MRAALRSLLRPLPFRDSSHLFMVAGVNAKRRIDGAPFSYPSYVELAARDWMRSGLDDFAAVTNDRFNATDGGRPERLTAIGMAIGTIAALLVSRAIRAVLFGVSSADPVTYAGGLLLFAAPACAALVVPARRAAGIDPLTALRSG